MKLLIGLCVWVCAFAIVLWAIKSQSVATGDGEAWRELFEKMDQMYELQIELIFRTLETTISLFQNFTALAYDDPVEGWLKWKGIK